MRYKSLGTTRFKERRSFAVLERLGEIAGTGPVWSQEGAEVSEAHRATAIASAGETLLGFIIDSAGDSGVRRSRVKKTWKALRPEPGARASVFLSHAMAAVLGRLAEFPNHHLNAERQAKARALVQAHFPWPDEDARLVADGVSRIDPEVPHHEVVQVGFSFHALSIVAGSEAARHLPTFQELQDPGAEPIARELSGMRFDFAWNYGKEAHLELTDPEGLARSQAGPGELEAD